jgi:hypothetical protein
MQAKEFREKRVSSIISFIILFLTDAKYFKVIVDKRCSLLTNKAVCAT